MAFPSKGGFPAKKKPKDFLDDVVDEMGQPEGPSKHDGDAYGASMDDTSEPDEADMGDEDPEAGEDRVMAAKTLGRAMGINDADWPKVAEALAAFVRTC